MWDFTYLAIFFLNQQKNIIRTDLGISGTISGWLGTKMRNTKRSFSQWLELFFLVIFLQIDVWSGRKSWFFRNQFWSDARMPKLLFLYEILLDLICYLLDLNVGRYLYGILILLQVWSLALEHSLSTKLIVKFHKCHRSFNCWKRILKSIFVSILDLENILSFYLEGF